MADWSTVASKKAAPTRPSPGTVQADNGSTWANAAGRKAGNGNVSQISRAPVQSKDKNPKRTAPVDPVASQQAAMRASGGGGGGGGSSNRARQQAKRERAQHIHERSDQAHSVLADGPELFLEDGKFHPSERHARDKTGLAQFNAKMADRKHELEFEAVRCCFFCFICLFCSFFDLCLCLFPLCA